MPVASTRSTNRAEMGPGIVESHPKRPRFAEYDHIPGL